MKRRAVAFVLILAALGFGVWQWVGAPGVYDGRSAVAVGLLIVAAILLWTAAEDRRRA